MAKILIVDDDPVLSRLYRTILENAGHTVENASDGEEALQKAKDIKPSLILADIMMPRMDGLSFLKKVKALKDMKKTPVILMTNLKDEDNAKTAMDEGAFKIIWKNELKPDQVAGLINEALSLHSTPGVE